MFRVAHLVPGTARVAPCLYLRSIAYLTYFSVRVLPCALFLTLATVGAPGDLNAQELGKRPGSTSSLPDDCLRVLKRQRSALSTLNVTFSIARRFSPPTSQRVGMEKCHFVADQGRFYYRSELALTDDAPLVEEKAYDGSVFYAGTASLTTPMVSKYLGDNPNDSKASVVYVDAPYLEAAGVAVPRTAKAWSTSSLDLAVLHLLETGTLISASPSGSTLIVEFEVPDPAVVDARGVDLATLARSSDPTFIRALRRLQMSDARRRVVLRLDRTKGYAIVAKDDFTQDGKRIQSIKCDKFEYSNKEDLWLPGLCTLEYYLQDPHLLLGFTEYPSLTMEISLEKFSFRRPRGMSFALVYRPGSVVADRTSIAAANAPRGSILYQVPASNESQRASAFSVRTKALLAVLSVLLILGVAAFVMFRRRR